MLLRTAIGADHTFTLIQPIANRKHYPPPTAAADESHGGYGGRGHHDLAKTDDATAQSQPERALCSTDLDCSLNGRCSQGRCECDKPWSGDSCGTMRFRPVSFPQGYGQSPNLTAWGGGNPHIMLASELHSSKSASNNRANRRHL